jgi:hypothetical protein
MYSDSIMYIPTKYSRHFSWDVIIGIRAWLDTICILHTSSNYFQSSHLLCLPHYPIQTFSCHLVYHFYNRFRFPSGKKNYSDTEVSFLPESSRYLRPLPTSRRTKLLYLLTYPLLQQLRHVLLLNSSHHLLVLHHLLLWRRLLQHQHPVLRVLLYG